MKESEARTADDLVATAARLSAGFAVRAAEHDRDGSFPFENFEALRDARMLNLTVPAAAGGEGASLETTSRVIEEIGRGEPSTALVLAMQFIHHALLARHQRWPEATRDLVVRESVAGIGLINSLRVEPELGTVSRGGLPATTATRTANGWRLRGHKLYGTGSPMLRFYQVYARTDDEPARMGAFLVPADSPGLRIVKTWDHLGLRASGSDDVILDDVEIPAAYALDLRPPLDWQTQVDVQSGAWNTIVVAALYHGVALAGRDWLVRYLNERTPSNLGAPLATLPRFQTAVGEIETLLYTSRELIYGAARAVDEERPQAVQVGIVKHVATANAIKALEIGLELVGNPGLSRTNPLERHYRDALCGRIHAPQADMVLLGAGRLALAR